MFKNIYNFLVYICCGTREEPKQKDKNLISEEYNELVEYLKKQSKKCKRSATCC